MIKSYSDLGAQHVDVLSEIGNIGAGNAATSLSVLIDSSVRISVPSVMILDYDSAVRTIGDPEDLGIAIMIKYSGEVNGIVLFLLSYKDAKGITDMISGEFVHDDSDELSDMAISTIKELGNILGSSYLGSISMLTGLQFDISIPYVAIDMIGAIMSAPLIEFSIDNEKILIIEESFLIEERSFNSQVILFADIPSLNKILERLGIEA